MNHTRDALEQRELSLCRQPIFVIGSPRSGTTALGLALGEHTLLWASDETHFLFDLLDPRTGVLSKSFSVAGSPLSGWFLRNSVHRTEFLRYLGLGINALVSSRSADRRWLDHTPYYTLIAEWLVDMFPDAVFIHILRDGRRVVNSMLNLKMDKHPPEDRTLIAARGGLPAWASDFRTACSTWSHFVLTARELERALPDRCITVVNEELIVDPQTNFDMLFRFLAVPYEDPPVTFFQNHLVNSSFRQDWAHSAHVALTVPWREWTNEQHRIFNEEAGKVLVECGFAADGSRSGGVL